MEYMEIAREKARILQQKQHATMLSIETSCDETAAAVIRDGRQVLSNVVYTQIPLHQKYGGVVPEIASRNHVEHLGPVVREALRQADKTLDQMDAIAVTYGPGLIGALLTGVSYAKGLAFAKALPLVPVNHIVGHIDANYLSHQELEPPFVCLVASGGHSHIVWVEDYCSFQLLGRTRDDAAGEAFDKAARALGLSYPGGPALEKLAKEGNPHAIEFHAGFNAKPTLDFSFSGIKTSVVNYIHTADQRGEEINRADVAASFQESVVETLADKAVRAALQQKSNTLALAGGVSANQCLRTRMADKAEAAGLRFYCPAFSYCTDNAAMIGCAGYYALMRGEIAPLSLNAKANASFMMN